MTEPETSSDGGFTLVELLVVVAMIGIILSAITGAIIVGLKTSDRTKDRLSDSTQVQLLSAYLPRDIQNMGAAAGDASDQPGASAGCTGAAGTNALALNWKDGYTSTSYGVTYRLVVAGSEQQLVRYACGGLADAPLVVARDLATSAGAVADLSLDPRITLTVTTASGYTRSITALRRTYASGYIAPPPPPCSVDAASVTPPSGSVTSTGVLVPAASISVSVSGPCANLSVQYRPDGTSVVTTGLGAGAGPHAAALQLAGWSAGARLIEVYSGTSLLATVPFTVTDALPCAVTNVVTSPTTGTRTANPAPNVVASDPVTVSADFSATCLGAYTLEYAPSGTLSTMAFALIGATRTITLPANTKWSDGNHPLIVKEGSTTLATGHFVVSPAPCAGSSITLTPTTVNADKNGQLNKSILVTVTTTGVCDAVTASFTPSTTAAQISLSHDGAFTTWTATIAPSTYSWSKGTKTFTAGDGAGAPLSPSQTANLKAN